VGRVWTQEFRYALTEELPDEQTRDRFRNLVYLSDRDWTGFGLPAGAERLAKLLDEKRAGFRVMELAPSRLRETLADRLGPEHVEVSHEP
jgi:hypothetical protein